MLEILTDADVAKIPYSSHWPEQARSVERAIIAKLVGVHPLDVQSIINQGESGFYWNIATKILANALLLETARREAK